MGDSDMREKSEGPDEQADVTCGISEPETGRLERTGTMRREVPGRSGQVSIIGQFPGEFPTS
jgi:hypothetical protein